MRLRRLVILATAASVGTTLALAPAASATPRPAPVPAGALAAHSHHGPQSRLGATTVTTAPGIATTLLRAGILPLPVLPRTGFSISLRSGLQVSYIFPITKSTADLGNGTGDIDHAGGIYFTSARAHLEIGKFDIDLAAGKIFATEVNFAPARIAVLDLDLSGLKVGTDRHGDTVLSGIGLNLDPAAAGALNATFHTQLPTDGSLRFAGASVTLT